MNQNSSLKDLLFDVIKTHTQADIANFCGVSQPAVSGWLTGRKRPRPAHLASIAFHCGLNPAVIAEAAGYDVDQVMRLVSGYQVPYFDLDHAKNELNTVYQARIGGNPQLAIDAADNLINWLRQKEMLASPTLGRELSLIRAQVLSEKSTALREIVLPEQVLLVTHPIVKELEYIAAETGDDRPFGLASLCQADAYYIVRKHEVSIQFAKIGLDYMKDPKEKLLLLRTLAADYGFLNADKSEHFKVLEKTEHHIRSIIENSNLSDFEFESICTALEGLARAQAVMGIERSLVTLEESSSIFYRRFKAEKRVAPFREIQQMRTRLEAVIHISPADKAAIEAIGNSGAALAKALGYPRYALQFERLLSGIL